MTLFSEKAFMCPENYIMNYFIVPLFQNLPQHEEKRGESGGENPSKVTDSTKVQETDPEVDAARRKQAEVEAPTLLQATKEAATPMQNEQPRTADPMGDAEDNFLRLSVSAFLVRFESDSLN